MSNSGKKRKNIIFNLIMIILVLVIAFSLYKIGTILYEYHQGTKEYKQVQEIAGSKENDFSGDINFDKLKEECRDVKAWLYSKDTVINYPVVQSDDNQYYLYRLINGQWNGKGSLFIDYRCSKPFEDFNTIIYGHRMKDGSMFHSLVDYRKGSYYKDHKEMMLITPAAKYNVEIFGVVTIPADSNKYKFDFSSDSEKTEYINWIKSKSEVDMGVDVNANDRIVMLSTCTYEFDEARLVVYGKLKEIKEEQ